jgi:sphinganine-1-phosphate aldolase
VASLNAHPALDKACHYFNIKLISIDLECGVSKATILSAFKREINSNTILLYCSAPNFPHGNMDPIAPIAALAKSKGIGCHVDNCLGGFHLSALKRLGILTGEDAQVRSATSCDAISCCAFYVVQRHVTPFRVAPFT